ncbi:alpha/beta hydrolase [Polaribacter sp.]|uniref:alpha/beta fold hydrolase n=1 Tax=Polaribacter sp. TaxID=1920175 RepID=UPI0025F66169|nr:alpha/beta hydrolase [Polaribacter sp.]
MKSKSSKRKYWLYTILIALILAINSIVYSDISVDDLKVEYANQYSKFIEVDGMQVHYRIEGEGFPIVLIHGTASSLHTWDDWTKELKKTNTIIRMDLPAFGLTGPNETADYSINTYTTFLDQFLNEIAIDSFHLAGNSLGGNIAWNYAAEHPIKVNKLILVASSGLPTNKPQPAVFKMAKMPVLSNLFLHITPKFFINKNMQEVYADYKKITDNLVSRYHKMALREGNRQAFIDRARMDFKQGSKANFEKLKNVQTPTLLIWGAQDNWIPLYNGKRMDSIMQNSKLVVLENSGHVPMEENPKESLDVLRSFLSN